MAQKEHGEHFFKMFLAIELCRFRQTIKFLTFYVHLPSISLLLIEMINESVTVFILISRNRTRTVYVKTRDLKNFRVKLIGNG